MKRRNFLKLSAAASAVTCVVGCGSSNDDKPETPEIPEIPENPYPDGTHFSACLVNCGSNCPIKYHSKDGVITQIETDYALEDQYGNHQVRACVRGRSLRQRTYAADRIKAPMKRVGKRGEGKFEEISWDEAFETIASKVTTLRDQYGPRSIYFHYGTGAYYGFNSANALKRALGASGGFLSSYSNYSWAQINAATPAILGDRTQSGSYLSEIANSDLFLGFGFNPFEIRMSGSGEQYDMLNALKTNPNLEVLLVDPRYTDTAVGRASKWYGIRPGTDGALAEAIAHEMISSGWVEQNSKAFIDKYAIGYDRESLENLKAEIEADSEHKLTKYKDLIDVEENYKDYILREGKYAGEELHDAAWAATVTGIDEIRIKEIAQKLMSSNAPYISIGAGTNRHACGEQTVRSLYMLPILTGKIGQPGTSNGALPRNYGRGTSGGLGQLNDQRAQISFFTWAEAIERGAEMDVLHDGVSRLDSDELDENGNGVLGTNIKAVFSAAGNALINQHSDINHTRKILEDESKCELVVVCDCWMTPSAEFADILLPDTTWLETNDLAGDSYASGQTGYVTFMKGIKPLYNARSMYQIGLGMAKAFGVEAAYSEGKTEEQWLEDAYQATKSRNSDWDMPDTYAEAQEIGVFRNFAPSTYIAMKSFIDDPENNPVTTPSGKMEIFSLDWAHKADTLIMRSDKPYDQITPLPEYTVPWQGYEDVDTKDDYPLQLAGYHTKGRTHSSYHNVPWLREAVEDALWINPQDAGGMANGTQVIVESPNGKIQVPIKITPRVMPGVVALGQGAWYKKGANDVDVGGCINTLTNYHPTPVSKGNPQHTIRVRINKA
ncbi:DMSO/selenate family reductase complex A subunit [Paraferrimonas haliotis]|uniref:Dimethyl sulfoxide reductase subunit A n=1 Tax=Paraferrimonas haliotis TaxID=2013866 RepID=A0AA37TMQ9_9GAMM|nr:DMSO/selenate family reductase complex A subunit [Paraferrimonas haliotis]GLS82275.1 dimethyl sulfoxide reductase subunit A [Paraferrimonas haliotis]